jgi:hypothetical protein
MVGPGIDLAALRGEGPGSGSDPAGFGGAAPALLDTKNETFFHADSAVFTQREAELAAYYAANGEEEAAKHDEIMAAYAGGPPSAEQLAQIQAHGERLMRFAQEARRAKRALRESKPFPRVNLSLREWKRQVDEEWERLSADWSYPDRKQFEKWRDSFRLCGVTARARVCGACTGVEIGYAEAAPPEGGFPCQNPICPHCNRTKAKHNARDLEYAVRMLPELAAERAWQIAPKLLAEIEEREQKAQQYEDELARGTKRPGLVRRWIEGNERVLRRLQTQRLFLEKVSTDLGLRFVTMTCQWDDEDPESYTVEGIRSRMLGMIDACANVWTEQLNTHSLGVAGWRWSLEMSDYGFVHAHGCYFGPWIVKESLEKFAQQAYEKAGHSWIERFGDDDRSQRGKVRSAGSYKRKGVRECTKYVAKGPGGACEDLLAGDTRWMVHPVLAARFALAVRGLDTHRGYGLLHGAPKPPAEAPPELPTHCAHCGIPGRFEWQHLPLAKYLRACHIAGKAGLRGSHWQEVAGRVYRL